MRTLGSAIQNVMKFLAITMLIALIAKAFFDIFTGCSDDKYNVQIKTTMYEIDSVDYHYMGRDNTLQSTPYYSNREVLSKKIKYLWATVKLLLCSFSQ